MTKRTVLYQSSSNGEEPVTLITKIKQCARQRRENKSSYISRSQRFFMVVALTELKQWAFSWMVKCNEQNLVLFDGLGGDKCANDITILSSGRNSSYCQTFNLQHSMQPATNHISAAINRETKSTGVVLRVVTFKQYSALFYVQRPGNGKEESAGTLAEEHTEQRVGLFY